MTALAHPTHPVTRAVDDVRDRLAGVAGVPLWSMGADETNSTIAEILAARLAAGLEREERQAEAAVRLSVWDDGHGKTHGRFTVDTALTGQMLRKALHAIASPRHRASKGLLGEPKPTPQRLGEAFVELIRRYPTKKLPKTAGLNATVVATMQQPPRETGADRGARVEVGCLQPVHEGVAQLPRHAWTRRAVRPTGSGSPSQKAIVPEQTSPAWVARKVTRSVPARFAILRSTLKEPLRPPVVADPLAASEPLPRILQVQLWPARLLSTSPSTSSRLSSALTLSFQVAPSEQSPVFTMRPLLPPPPPPPWSSPAGSSPPCEAKAGAPRASRAELVSAARAIGIFVMRPACATAVSHG